MARPMAITSCPTRTSSADPSGRTGCAGAESDRRTTARSASGEVRSTRPCAVLPDERRTVTAAFVPTTWLLVTRTPGPTKNPLPRPSRVSMETTAGAARLITSSRDPGVSGVESTAGADEAGANALGLGTGIALAGVSVVVGWVSTTVVAGVEVSRLKGSLVGTSLVVRNMREAVRPARPTTNRTTMMIRAGVNVEPPWAVDSSALVQRASDEFRSYPHRHVASRPGTRRSQAGQLHEWTWSDISFLIGRFCG